LFSGSLNFSLCEIKFLFFCSVLCYNFVWAVFFVNYVYKVLIFMFYSLLGWWLKKLNEMCYFYLWTNLFTNPEKMHVKIFYWSIHRSSDFLKIFKVKKIDWLIFMERLMQK
jgi:hypothetical protein